MTIYTRPEMFIDTTPTFAQNIAGSLGTLAGKGIDSYLKNQAAQKREQLLRDSLEQQGITGALQDLYIYGTEGGRTDITKGIVDAAQRNSYVPISDQEDAISLDDLALEYERNNFSGLKGNEVATKRRDLAKANTTYFKDELKRTNNIYEQSRDIKTLKNLNKSKDLLKWYDRINLDNSTGELKFPGLGSKNAQAYVKALNRFYDGLKGTFGARITNLDVRLYGQRLPTLANSKEARELILNQMDIVNKINQIYYNKLDEIYAKYQDRWNEAQIESFTRRAVKDEIAPLEQQYNALTEQIDSIEVPEESLSDSVEERSNNDDTTDIFEELPDPATEKGNTLEDESTGQKYRSDGKKWIKVS